MAGVEFNPPPPHMMADVMTKIGQYVSQIPPDKKGAIVGVATNKGVNAAIVMKAPGGFQVQAWIGKNWGEEVTVGGGITKTF